MNTTMMPVIESGFEALPSCLGMSGIQGKRCMIVADENTAPLFAEKAREKLQQAFSEVSVYVLPAGEEHKKLETLDGLFRELIRLHFDRHDVIAALGGGVVGDMAGFAAAIYLRGIRVIQLPTTLLAQIDSSIGGKTAVDFDGYKNMVGAFHMPSLVYSNTAALATLPAEQFTAGMGEVVKSALLADAEYFRFLEAHAAEIKAMDLGRMTEMIRRCARIKVGIVERDPLEKGERALLNLGHTIGHAVEKAKNFELLHGSCVALGLIAASSISQNRGLLKETDMERIRALLEAFGLPLSVSGLNAEEILSLTKSDKKMKAGRIRFVLLRSIGEAFCAEDVTDEELRSGICAILRP